MKRLLIIIFLLLTSLAGFSHKVDGWHPYKLAISRAQGLPSDEVYDILEDKMGFMWFATGVGLCRYDGHSFKLWQCEAQTSSSGSCIRQDGLGRIWYENFDGYLYYTSNNQLVPLKQRPPWAFTPFCITDRHLFVVTTDGVDIYDIKSLNLTRHIPITFTRFEHSASSETGLVIVADDVLFLVDTALQLSSQKLPSTPAHVLHQAYCIGDSIFVVNRATGQNSILIYNNSLRPIGKIDVYSEGQLRSISKVDENFWLCSSSGCQITESTRSQWLFPGSSISAIARDRRGNYWFSTTNEGVFLVPELATKINALNGYKVRQVVTTPAGVLAGSQNGDLLLLPTGTDELQVLHHDAQNADIYYLYADSNNILYCATGFTMLRGNGKVSKTGLKAIKSVCPVGDAVYVFAASGGCGLLHRPGSMGPKIAGIHNWEHEIDTILLPNTRGRSVVYDPTTRHLFFATNRGIISMAPNGDTMSVLFRLQPIYASNLVRYDGYIYAADNRGNLLRFRPGEAAEMPPGIPGNGEIKLLKQSNGHIYYITRQRLYELQTGGTATALRCHIDAAAINDIAAADSTLWFATNDGLVTCRKEIAKRRSAAGQSAFYINEIRLNDKPINNSELSNLSPRDNNIAISYSVVEYAESEPSIVSYRLNDGNWIALSNENRTLQFRSLAPGQYRLQFRVNDRDAGPEVAFNIRSPFWRQPWFYLLCALGLFIIGQTLYNRRMTKQMRKIEEQRQKSQLEEQLSRSMLTALRSQMNPHFFFNALNTIQAYIFTNEKTKAGSYLSKFSMLTRTILEMSETETVMLSEEVDAMRLYLDLEKMRFGNDFEYSIEQTGINDIGAIEIPSMILQPFIENAVKHGLMHKEGTKKLLVTLERRDNVIRIVVDDNGIGMARSLALNEIKKNKYKSYSTRATAERVRLLNERQPGKINVQITDKTNENGQPEGTAVTITIVI